MTINSPILPSDYSEYSGTIERWEYGDVVYPDCSWGCLYWKAEETNPDYGICTNPRSPRYNLNTFEHQAGYGCFDAVDEEL